MHFTFFDIFKLLIAGMFIGFGLEFYIRSMIVVLDTHEGSDTISNLLFLAAVGAFLLAGVLLLQVFLRFL